MKVSFLEEGEWLDALLQCPGSTFFHTPYWYKVWESYKQYDPVCYVFDFPDGQRVVFPLAVFKLMKGLLRGAISGPGGVYGGPLSPLVISDEKLQRMVAYLKRRYALLDVQCSPFQEFGGGADMDLGFTQVIDIADVARFRRIDLNWTKGHRSAAKTGLRKCNIERVALSGSIDKYWHLYNCNLARWGARATSIYTKVFFDVLARVPDRFIDVWVSYIESIPVYSCICFSFNNHYVYWQGSGDDRFFSFKPVHAIQYSAIEYAISLNLLSYYDFNPSGGHEGVTRFKKGFGAKKIKYEVINESSQLFALYQTSRNYLK